MRHDIRNRLHGFPFSIHVGFLKSPAANAQASVAASMKHVGLFPRTATEVYLGRLTGSLFFPGHLE